ncbi:hypothetical protein M8C21_026393 [Ambrosia artemisiifolia]|uniref:Uncharacterized protein n=1 Tax=Ambrosia artemisiifolia TaxID=4212 RepID=A0AAD5C2I5_AMBAR|nr:hypothetical protein M8C21_026393 [Ambrosia artemisiifolia]
MESFFGNLKVKFVGENCHENNRLRCSKELPGEMGPTLSENLSFIIVKDSIHYAYRENRSTERDAVKCLRIEPSPLGVPSDLAPRKSNNQMMEMIDESVKLSRLFCEKKWPIIAFLDTHQPGKLEHPYPSYRLAGSHESDLIKEKTLDRYTRKTKANKSKRDKQEDKGKVKMACILSSGHHLSTIKRKKQRCISF